MSRNKLLFLIIVFFFTTHLAYAEKRVFEPYAEQGEWELETTGVYDLDHAKTKNAVQEYHYALGYGVNGFWHTELELEAETASTDESITSFQATHMEWENIFQLAEKGQCWLDPGVYLAYEAPLRKDEAGQFEGKILLEKDFQRVSNILNLSLNKEVGGGADRHLDGGVSWSTKYRLSEYFEPGVEYWNDFSAITHHLDFNQQSHQLGPVFYGRLFHHMRYDIGYLFGVSDAAPKGELKWVLEYEF